MPNSESNIDPSDLRRRALSRWENEGGAVGPAKKEPSVDVPDLTNADLVQLRIRVIALENLLITILAEGPEQQRLVARDMAAYISPRPGFTQHPLTLKASDHMTDLIRRADDIRTR